MKIDDKHRPIGVFDSGVGGISLLSVLTDILPNENFVFFGDHQNAPYGDKSSDEIFNLSKNVVDKLVQFNIKALVIACNTATSAAKKRLEIDFPELPIIGIEPALKEAIDYGEDNILVLGTKATIKLEKFNNLLNRFKNYRKIYSTSCSGFADYVESGQNNENELEHLFSTNLERFRNKHIEAIVLGCTHYPFLMKDIERFFGKKIRFYTGYVGVAKQLQRRLYNLGLLTDKEVIGRITFLAEKKTTEDFYKQYYLNAKQLQLALR